MTTIVQSVSNGSNLGAFDSLQLPSNVTIGNLLVYLIAHSKTGDPQAPAIATFETLGGNAAWTHLGSFVYTAPSGDRWAVGAYAKIANGTERKHRNLLGGENSCGIWELSGSGVGDLTLVENNGSGTAINAGSLGSPGASSIAMMVAGQYTPDVGSVTFTPLDFTTDQEWGAAFFGNTRPWWYGHAVGDGTSLAAAITSSVSQPWAAIGVLAAPTVVPAPVAAFTYDPQTGVGTAFVNFDASDSTGDIDTYDWDFGDGDSGSGVTPAHFFIGAGTYHVTLTVTGPGGSDTETHDVVITAAPALSSDSSMWFFEGYA